NTEAQYRLALIWAVGGENFPADLAEAYKWALLAAESKGIWGSLAADLRAQLDKVAGPGQQAEGEKRLIGWKEARAPKEAEPAPPPPPPPQQPAPAIKNGETGCPGWPFPTLPCTEQFPALPGMRAAPQPQQQPAAPQPALAARLGELNEAMAQFDCASLRS